MNRPAAIAIVGAAIIGVALYGLGRWDAAVSSREAPAIAGARAWLAAGNARRADRARLIAARDRAGARADRLAAEARTHAASDEALNAALDRATTAVDSLPIVLAQRDTARAAVASWAQAFAALTLKDRADSTRADRAEAAADTAAAHLRALIPIADCHMLGLGFLPRCPSRVLSAVLGVGTGAAAVLLLTR